MATQQNNSGQDNPFVRTMQKDLESAETLPASQPARNENNNAPSNIPLAQEKSFSEIEAASPAPTAIDSSSPFSATYFQEEKISSPTDPLQTKNTTSDILPKVPASSTSPEMAGSLQFDQPNKGSSRSRTIAMIIVSVLIIAFLAAGGYYYWKSRGTAQPVAEIPSPAVVTQPEPTTVKVNPLAEKYSSTNPNYLSLDTNTATQESITSSLEKTAGEISESGITAPVEFIVTDNNNNPVAFHIFCALTKINLPPALLSALGDNFSLFFYSDAGKIRLGASVELKNKTVALAQMKTIESKLPSIISTLFLSETPSVQTAAFKDGSYLTYAIRYANLNPDSTLSIDYTSDQKTLYVGTSKNTLRVILDKIQNNHPAADAASPVVTPDDQTSNKKTTIKDTTTTDSMTTNTTTSSSVSGQ